MHFPQFPKDSLKNVSHHFGELVNKPVVKKLKGLRNWKGVVIHGLWFLTLTAVLPNLEMSPGLRIFRSDS